MLAIEVLKSVSFHRIKTLKYVEDCIDYDTVCAARLYLTGMQCCKQAAFSGNCPRQFDIIANATSSMSILI